MGQSDERDESANREDAGGTTAPQPGAGVPWAHVVARATAPSEPSHVSAPSEPTPEPPAEPTPEPPAEPTPEPPAEPTPEPPAEPTPEPPAEHTPEPADDAGPHAASAGTATLADANEPGDVEPAHHAQTERHGRGWVGVTSFISAVLFVSPVAIILGHWGLSAAKRGRAKYRSPAIAGLILGYLGLIAWGVGAWLYLTAETPPGTIDAQAQQDVSAVGAAAATQAVETRTLPDVEQVGADYSVAGETIATHLETEHQLTFTGSSATDWCLDVSYEGGDQAAYSYTATGGMVAGSCLTREDAEG